MLAFMGNNWDNQAFTANDNDPAQVTLRGDAVGFRALYKENQQARQNYILTQRDLAAPEEKNPTLLVLAWSIFALWALALALCIWSYAAGQPIGMRLVSATALITTGIFHAYFAKIQNHFRSSELGICTSLAGFIGLLLTASTQLGLPLTPNAGLCLFAVTALVIAYLNGSPFALIASIAAGFVWAGLFFDGYVQASPWMVLIPALASLQALLALHMRAPLLLFSSIIMAYSWIVGGAWQAYNSGTLSPEYLLAGGFLLGLMHQQISQSTREENILAKGLHILFGWALMCAALTGLIMWGQNSQSELWAVPEFTAPITRLVWLAATGLALGIIALTSLYRRKSEGISFAAIGWLLFTAALVPALVWLEPNMTAYISQIQPNSPGQMPDLPYAPLSFVLGGIVFALACFFALRGLQERRYYFTLAGILVIAAIAELCLHNIITRIDSLALFVLGFLIACAVKTMTAQHNSMAIASNRRGVRRSAAFDEAA